MFELSVLTDVLVDLIIIVHSRSFYSERESKTHDSGAMVIVMMSHHCISLKLYLPKTYIFLQFGSFQSSVLASLVFPYYLICCISISSFVFCLSLNLFYFNDS